VLRELRESQGWTREALAHECSICSGTIKNAENGVLPRRVVQAALAAALGVEPGLLWPPRQRRAGDTAADAERTT
jgi:transcriptional regulator with XRE-family HTH domain